MPNIFKETSHVSLAISTIPECIAKFLEIKRTLNYFFNLILTSIDEGSVYILFYFNYLILAFLCPTLYFIQVHRDKVACKKLLAIKLEKFIIAVSVVFNNLLNFFSV